MTLIISSVPNICLEKRFTRYTQYKPKIRIAKINPSTIISGIYFITKTSAFRNRLYCNVNMKVFQYCIFYSIFNSATKYVPLSQSGNVQASPRQDFPGAYPLP